MTQTETNWDTLDWAALERLRDGFLAGAGATVAYWQSRADLANYDLTFAQRIAWKWDAVLAELKLRGWAPPPGEVLDWGCGSGVAGRCVLREFGGENFPALRLFDRSSLAMEFAAARAKAVFPKLTVNSGVPDTGRLGLLVLSHVLNELPDAEREALLQLARRADAVLWVEPGTHADSRALIAMREGLRQEFEVIAPCTHHETCGLLAAGNERHWCHNFAAPPPGVLADSDWVRFGRRMGIDLRSLPYSFLALERKGLRPAAEKLAGWSRVVGAPRVYKGFARLFSCQADGVRDLTLQKRDAPEVFKRLKDEEPVLLVQGTVNGEKLAAVEAALP
ncbi:MAG: ribosomal small subunit Rsm22 [Limisphaerales bacterium]|nr:MAG: ribosomal small subunit Rsm22 [Limisphaerales bacterium]KAG0510199.1 MAG: ribosomal small subunit Rsm22 [Limisphaerales bacterium]TXT51918.1 MAG: ribosomal small subunit Rsm22 [Limisphaerales bacterium]